MTHKAKAPAKVLQDQGKGKKVETIRNDETTARRAKRKLKNGWYEDAVATSSDVAQRLDHFRCLETDRPAAPE